MQDHICAGRLKNCVRQLFALPGKLFLAKQHISGYDQPDNDIHKLSQDIDHASRQTGHQIVHSRQKIRAHPVLEEIRHLRHCDCQNPVKRCIIGVQCAERFRKLFHPARNIHDHITDTSVKFRKHHVKQCYDHSNKKHNRNKDSNRS